MHKYLMQILHKNILDLCLSSSNREQVSPIIQLKHLHIVDTSLQTHTQKQQSNCRVSNRGQITGSNFNKKIHRLHWTCMLNYQNQVYYFFPHQIDSSVHILVGTCILQLVYNKSKTELSVESPVTTYIVVKPQKVNFICNMRFVRSGIQGTAVMSFHWHLYLVIARVGPT